MKVLFYSNVLEYTNGENFYEPSSNCSNIQELVRKLEERYGERFRMFLLGEETCFFLVNGSGIMMTGGLNTKLTQGDKIEVLPFTEAG